MAKEYYSVRLKKTVRGPRTRKLSVGGASATFSLDVKGEDVKVLALESEVVAELRANGSWDIDKAKAPDVAPGGIGVSLFPDASPSASAVVPIMSEDQSVEKPVKNGKEKEVVGV